MSSYTRTHKTSKVQTDGVVVEKENSDPVPGGDPAGLSRQTSKVERGLLRSATSRTPVEEVDLATWLSLVQDESVVSLRCLPATHNSCCVRRHPWHSPFLSFFGFPWARTQEKDLREQLHLGVRFLDLRVSDDGRGGLWVSHFFLTDYSLELVLFILNEFLEKHASEFIVLFLRKDHDCSSLDIRQLERMLLHSGLHFFPPEDTADFSRVKVRDLRGRVLLIAPDVENANVGGACWPRDLLQYEDIWRCASDKEAKQVLHTFIKSGNLRKKRMLKLLTGIALDGSFGKRPPGLTSKQMNDWFFEKVECEEWEKGLGEGVGVLMVDFIDEGLARTMVKFALGK